MPNQHTAEKIIKKCDKKGCKKTMSLTPSSLRKSEKHYCCKSHANESRVCHKYGADALKYIKANILKDGFSGIAQHLGVTIDAIKRQITTWRKGGHKIPYLRKKEDGEIKTIIQKGLKRTFKKENGKWVKVGNEIIAPYQRRVKKEKVIKEKKKPGRKPKPKPLPTPKTYTVAKSNNTMRKVPKKAEIRLPNKIVDQSQLKSVRIDSKTTVMVNKNIPDHVAISDYLERRKESNNYHSYKKAS